MRALDLSASRTAMREASSNHMIHTLLFGSCLRRTTAIIPLSADCMNASRFFVFYCFAPPCDQKVFGTSTGSILITDYHGNETRRLQPHTMAVTDLSLDIRGDFLARQGINSAWDRGERW